MSTARWIVDVKGEPNDTFEISVLREDNAHGRRSYGWMGEDKLYVSGSGGPCRYTVCPAVFRCLVLTAQLLAGHLNRGGSIEDAETLALIAA